MFPCDFAWGAATAAYQIEGGWDSDNKGPSIWDTFCHRDKGDNVLGGQNADVTCSSYTMWDKDLQNADVTCSSYTMWDKDLQNADVTCSSYTMWDKDLQNADVTCSSYTMWDKDLQCVRQLGLTHYRMSLSWARLLPDGTTKNVNQKGVQYYNKVIDDLLLCKVSPMVTLYHFDLPQALQDQGGWKSPDMATLFDGYARFCFRTFGDRVKLWVTLNEPYVCAKLGHEDGVHAPGVTEPGGTGAAYLVGHNMLRGHALAWHSYDSLYRAQQNGAVSIALNSDWAEPLDPSDAGDVAATERYLAFTLGWFAWPVFVTGDYPEVMRAAVDAQSETLGYDGGSRLPTFSTDEPAVLGTADFFALNYYTSRKVRKPRRGRSTGRAPLGVKSDQDAEDVMDPSWPVCGVSWLAVVPPGLRKLLCYIKETFNNPEVYITENGFAQTGPLQMEDSERCGFYRDTINEVANAIGQDGVNVRGYFAWSLMDNFEWSDGFSARFGLFHVDFSDPERPRTMYRSGREYALIISKHRSQTSRTNPDHVSLWTGVRADHLQTQISDQ